MEERFIFYSFSWMRRGVHNSFVGRGGVSVAAGALLLVGIASGSVYYSLFKKQIPLLVGSSLINSKIEFNLNQIQKFSLRAPRVKQVRVRPPRIFVASQQVENLQNTNLTESPEDLRPELLHDVKATWSNANPTESNEIIVSGIKKPSAESNVYQNIKAKSSEVADDYSEEEGFDKQALIKILATQPKKITIATKRVQQITKLDIQKIEKRAENLSNKNNLVIHKKQKRQDLAKSKPFNAVLKVPRKVVEIAPIKNPINIAEVSPAHSPQVAYSTQIEKPKIESDYYEETMAREADIRQAPYLASTNVGIQKEAQSESPVNTQSLDKLERVLVTLLPTPKASTQPERQPEKPQGPPAPPAPSNQPPVNEAPPKEESPKKEEPKKQDGGMNHFNARTSKSSFQGQIFTAFANTPIVDATVQVVGTRISTKTNEQGLFSFDGFITEGILPVVVTRDGYLLKRLDLRSGEVQKYELITENDAVQLALASQDRKLDNTSLIFGELVSGQESKEALKVSLITPSFQSQKTDPIYINEKGIPEPKLQMTSKRGQFLFFNLRPGTYILTIQDVFGQERAPHLVHVSENEGLIRKFSLGEKQMITGRVFNAIGNVPVAQAKIELLGSEKKTTADHQGQFTLGPLYIDCFHPLNYLHVEKEGFYRNRIDHQCGGPKDKNLYIFPSSHIDGISVDAGIQLKQTSTVIMGHVSLSKIVRIQLWGPEEIEPTQNIRGKDFYFSADGILRPHLQHTNPKNSNFVIFDAPEGLSYLQTFNKAGQTLTSWPVLTSASTVNVFLQ